MRQYLLATQLSVILLLSLGCAKDPSQDVPAATPTQAAPAAKAAPEPKAAPAPKEAPADGAANPAKAAAPKGSIALSGEIVFVGSKVTGSHEGVFKTWTGYALVPEGNLENASFQFEIDTASVFADPKERTKWSPKLEKHLRDPDFFDVEKFPKASFASTKIVKDSKGAAGTYTVSGNLTIKGVSKAVSFPAQISFADSKFEASSEFSINRQDFGISYPGKPDNLIRDGVVLKIKLKG
jgi:polyisoprenoid-binding protein YceI